MSSTLHFEEYPERGLGNRPLPPGKPNPQATTRLGSSAVITAPNPDRFDYFPSTLGNWDIIGDTVRVLDVNLGDALDGFTPGSWVLTLSASIEDNTVVSSGSIASLGLAPLVARITFGTGASQQTIEVDAWRNVIAIPSSTMRVEIFYTQIAQIEFPAPFTTSYGIFNKVRVSANVTRSTEGNLSAPVRSYFASTQLLGGIYHMPVPRYSTRFRLFYPNHVLDTASNPLNNVIVYSAPAPSLGGTGAILDQVSEPVVQSMFRTACPRTLPPYADSLNPIAVLDTSPYYQVAFDVDF